VGLDALVAGSGPRADQKLRSCEHPLTAQTLSQSTLYHGSYKGRVEDLHAIGAFPDALVEPMLKIIRQSERITK
jgi:hypothetical protein